MALSFQMLIEDASDQFAKADAEHLGFGSERRVVDRSGAQ